MTLANPTSLGIAVTGACNLNCLYCYYAEAMDARSDLSSADWLDFFEKAGSLGVMRISMGGGEPFVRPDLFQLVDGVIANRMRYVIITNGTLINEKTIRAFDEGKRRIRLDAIQVSMDGSCPEIHNRTRPGSFGASLNGLTLLHNADLPVIVRVTINRHNLDDLDNLARLLLDRIGIAYFSTNEAMAMEAGRHTPTGLSFSERLRAMKTMDRIRKRYPGRVRAQAGPQALLDMFSAMETARRTGRSQGPWCTGALTACTASFCKLDVLHDGTIVPCPMLHSIHLGNIRTDAVEDIWRRHPVLKQMRSRCGIPMRRVPGCEDCEWADWCNGGCPSLVYESTGDLNRSSSNTCYRRFIRKAKRMAGPFPCAVAHRQNERNAENEKTTAQA